MTAHRPTLLLFSLSAILSAQTVPDRLLQALEWRNIGPFRGGRSVAATGVPGQPHTFLFGSVGGGIWKSTNTGISWEPVFDAQPVASIGALAAAPSNGEVIYAGTGETDIRSDLAIGGGVYKSIDGGKTWAYAGLRDTRQIGRIAIHPTNPDIAYLAALGRAYTPNEERGVFRTADGGKTWRKVLYKNPDTGATDLAMDPATPKTIYAAMWNAHRPPWSQYGPVEGPGSGLFKTTDGGDTWTQLMGHGLPGGQWGRLGVATGRGARVYALIDSKEGGGLFRSDDAGATWTRASADPRITSRNWYFSSITVDQNNPDHVYVPNVSLYRSRDAGKTFEVLKGAPGGDDYHFLWIDPSDSTRMICGSDQGAVISVDGGKSWSPWYNQPTAQMYHVSTDNQFPYWVYGSQQDSGTVALPSRTDWRTISEYDRRTVGGAESGNIQPDPLDPNIFYVSNTFGSLVRFDRRTTESQNITPWPTGGFGLEISQRKYRFPWTAPLVFSDAEPGALYYGAQYVLKTTDGGLHWNEISPDLTGGEHKPVEAAPAGPVTAENAKRRGYGVVYSIAPSPKQASLIWAGSDTGLLHVTRDGGKTWTNVTPHGLSEWSKITHIEASHFDPAVAYAAVDRHRLDDYQPHLFRTADYGQTWQPIATGIGDGAFLNAVREDPKRRGLLFSATERGLYISFNDGAQWQPLQLKLPVTSVRDLVIHGSDLVIATHGRGFWILDDFTPLRQYSDAVATAGAAWLAKPASAVRVQSAGFLGTPLPPEVPQAKNPPAGAVIDYVLQSPPDGEVTMEILDGAGELIRRFSSRESAPARSRALTVADVWVQEPRRLTANAGLNRFVWDLRYPAAGADGGFEGRASGPLALPGSYTVKLTAGGVSLTQPLEVTADPRSVATPADLKASFGLSMNALREIRRAADLIRSATTDDARRRIGAARRDLSAVLSVTVSADRTPPAAAYMLFENAVRELNK